MSKKYKYWEIIKYWQALNINDIAKLATILNNFQILFAYNSCTIEGNNIDYYNVREIFENGKVINFTGDLRTLYEIKNQKDCAAYLLDKIISKEPLSVELIKKIHKLLTKGTYDEIRYKKKYGATR